MKANTGKIVAKGTISLLLNKKIIKTIMFLMTENKKIIGSKRHPIVLSKKNYDFIIKD
jgi:hydrogenase maturation factor HypF (carbamoyltransferase family)